MSKELNRKSTPQTSKKQITLYCKVIENSRYVFTYSLRCNYINWTGTSHGSPLITESPPLPISDLRAPSIGLDR